MAVRTVCNPPVALHIDPAVCFLAIEMSKTSWIVTVHTPLTDKISRYKLKDRRSDRPIPIPRSMLRARRRHKSAGLGEGPIAC
jgi:hypothetical protein